LHATSPSGTTRKNSAVSSGKRYNNAKFDTALLSGGNTTYIFSELLSVEFLLLAYLEA
jgi:hypothetical protein